MRIGVWQTEGTTGDPAGNIARLAALLPNAGAAGVELLLAPELWTTGYNDAAAIRRHAEPADGPSRAAIARLAAEHRIAIAWGYPEIAGAIRYNSAQLVGSDGAALLNYRKVHLWGDHEKALFTPAPPPGPPVTYRGWGIAFSICYDTEFPELVRRQVLAGADLILAPTALAVGGNAIPDLIIPVRAIENGVHIAFCNRSGAEGDLVYHGGSRIVGPAGEVLAAAATMEALVVADIGHAATAAARTRTPYLADRRADLLRF